MKEKRISEEKFYDNTLLNRNVMYDIKQNKSRPQLRTVITICIGLNLEPYESLELIRTAGYTLSKSLFLDCAYMEIIFNYYDNDIIECNEILEKLGVDEKYHLGSRQRY
ncbi:MAG: hypothetical protein IK057_03010 [Clostridia bacterium]|nr:hypothetical protein [Clostridia bacterium]